MKVYVASPLGFADSTRAYLDRVVNLLRGEGQEVHDPWDQPEGLRVGKAEQIVDPAARLDALREANRDVGQANENAIRSSNWMLAILDGVDIDSGTASEIGFGYSLGKIIVGLRTDFRRAGDNDAAVVNLQVQYWIEASGGRIVRSIERQSGKGSRSGEIENYREPIVGGGTECHVLSGEFRSFHESLRFGFRGREHPRRERSLDGKPGQFFRYQLYLVHRL